MCIAVHAQGRPDTSLAAPARLPRERRQAHLLCLSLRTRVHVDMRLLEWRRGAPLLCIEPWTERARSHLHVRRRRRRDGGIGGNGERGVVRWEVDFLFVRAPAGAFLGDVGRGSGGIVFEHGRLEVVAWKWLLSVHCVERDWASVSMLQED